MLTSGTSESRYPLLEPAFLACHSRDPSYRTYPSNESLYLKGICKLSCGVAAGSPFVMKNVLVHMDEGFGRAGTRLWKRLYGGDRAFRW